MNADVEPEADERDDFERYLDEGTPIGRIMTPAESEYVYRNLK